MFMGISCSKKNSYFLIEAAYGWKAIDVLETFLASDYRRNQNFLHIFRFGFRKEDETMVTCFSERVSENIHPKKKLKTESFSERWTYRTYRVTI